MLRALTPLLALLAALLGAVQELEPLLTEPLPVVRVIDGDTLWVRRGGRVEKLRLLSVDTEEQILGGQRLSPTKPETLFGDECAAWARAFFAELASDDGPPRVRLLFPTGVEQRDVFGRLLCHVILPDGRDFNVLLVREGKSPYFNKYGDSLVKHDELVAAQRAARAARRGIWDPATNPEKAPGMAYARRPYERLLPWWRARADAVAAFRADGAAGRVLAAEDVEGLRERLAGDAEAEVEVFGEVAELREELDGALHVHFRESDPDERLVAVLPPDARAEVEPLLRGALLEFRQNYVRVAGELAEEGDGLVLFAAWPDQWRLAGPEPVSGR